MLLEGVIQPEKERMDKMLLEGVIEPAHTHWAAPTVFAPKKDGSPCFCVDYRKLNAISKRDVYPIPRTDACVESLGEDAFFSTVDADSRYWQVELVYEDLDETAFTSHCGLYRFERMPHELRNAPSPFP